jgi:uroporphyrin-III C-methyltransferase/precorrin-2 dehydrogenase/sirohydrochlorin ferrochelatase
LVENGSLPNQRTLIGTLGELPARARHHVIIAPALLILGEVAALASILHWHGELLDAHLPTSDVLLADAA